MALARGLRAEEGLWQTARSLGGRLTAAVRMNGAISSHISRWLWAMAEDPSGRFPSTSRWCPLEMA